MAAVAVTGLVLGYAAWLGREDLRSEVEMAIRLALGVGPVALFLLLTVPLRPTLPPPD